MRILTDGKISTPVFMFTGFMNKHLNYTESLAMLPQ
jgi:hypothetical protein